MGIFDVIKNLGKKEETNSQPFKITTNFQPYRINSHKNESVDLIVAVKNNSDKPKMMSIVAKCPKNLGFGTPAINKQEQKKLGEVKAGEERTVVFKVHGNSNTSKNDYPIGVFVYSHFIDYDHVENAARKIVNLRAV